MIVGMIGLPGSGKTYHMTEIGQRLLADGQDVFSSHEMKGSRPIESARQLIRMNHCTVFFDEMHQDYDARQWYHLDPIVKHVLTQSRKYSINVYWSAQDWFYMDPFIRRITDFAWLHEATFRDPDTGRSRIGRHKAYKVSGADLELKKRRPTILARKTIWIRKRTIEAYDSYKKIMLTSNKVTDEELQAIKDPYLAPIIEEVERSRHTGASLKAVREIPSLPDPFEEEDQQTKNQPSQLDGDQDAYNLTHGVEREEPTEHTQSVVNGL